MGDRTRAFFLLELSHKGEFYHSYTGATGDTHFLLWMGERELNKLVNHVETQQQAEAQVRINEMLSKAKVAAEEAAKNNPKN